MSRKITLLKIINIVLEEKGVIEGDKTYDGNVKRIRRGFDELISGLGGEKEDLKDEGGHFKFEESEIPFMKIILGQFLEPDSLISKLTYKRSKPSDFSLMDVDALIQEILEEQRKYDANEEVIQQLENYLNTIFITSPMRSLQRCHLLIDTLFLNLQDFTTTQQAFYLNKIEAILQKEFALRIAESTINITELSKIFLSMGCQEQDEVLVGRYDYCDLETSREYIQRDKEMLAKIQGDDDLRAYIEKKLRAKAEDIFN